MTTFTHKIIVQGLTNVLQSLSVLGLNQLLKHLVYTLQTCVNQASYSSLDCHASL